MLLSDLDKAFTEMWKHPTQLPALLNKWQEMVDECLRTADKTDAFKVEFESYLAKWQSILSKNRDLLNAEQNELKEKLKIGEMKVDPSVIEKKFHL